jgi:ribonuclease VapC
MLIDSSALLAIIFGEPEADRFVEVIAADDVRAAAAPALVEVTATLLVRNWAKGQAALDELLEELDIDVVAMTAGAAKIARSAYARYGKGVGSPAVLNFGDCLAYGVAMDMREPLLFKGNDFTRTDLPAVRY